ncbi:universal stress protein [Sphingobium boeckii]|uniref:Nucleotide-binding universal stress UspA family protein n=1 Tax=Sphingobium boeckii TaxID=1082345 RepID=A0A7W9EG38_9SPHN|nr:universal stress protein [Sphingobium boeckii]MBB5686660.1 nucleotide-binding universal stress UspA family protein [Sphingobium boeckii]
MKNILLLVHDDEGQESRLQAALDLTRALGGHLSCIDVAVLPMVVGDLYGGAGTAMLLADERAREGQNKAKLEARLAREDVSWDWIDFTGSLVEGVLEAASLADLIVLNRKLDSFPYPDMHDAASRILMHARRPVVAVPETLTCFKLDRAVIAWDGQAACIATMQACVPILALAKEVEIFTVRDGGGKIEPAEAAEYLSRHGIHASVRIIDDGLDAADHLITEECVRLNADYVVMGAYSRGRLMEAFGGVTKRMLANSKLPLILGH